VVKASKDTQSNIIILQELKNCETATDKSVKYAKKINVKFHVNRLNLKHFE